MNSIGRITIDSDEWQDAGKIYNVNSYRKYDDKIELVLVLEGGQTVVRTVPERWVTWVY